VEPGRGGRGEGGARPGPGRGAARHGGRRLSPRLRRGLPRRLS
jgi:hypothetical protein